MKMKFQFGKYLVAVGFASAVLFTGCASFRNVRISYQIDENKPVKSVAVETDSKPQLSNRIDFDASPRLTIVGAITGNDGRKPRGNPAIEISGGLYENPKNPYDKSSPYNTNMGNTKKAVYFWEGSVIWRNMKAYSRIDFKTAKKDGKFNFTVKAMDCGKITMTSHLDYGNKTARIPLKVFSATDGTDKYEAFITQDKNYVAFGADSGNASLVEKYTPKSTTRELFNMKGQVIQILDSKGELVASITDDKYNLFMAEDDSRTETVIQLIGMIGTYTGIMSVMD